MVGLLHFAVVGFQAAALKPRINPRGHLGPQTELDPEQRVNFKAAQLPTLIAQLSERSPRRGHEFLAQFPFRQEPADDSFNRSM
jgi:hypothetical protein